MESKGSTDGVRKAAVIVGTRRRACAGSAALWADEREGDLGHTTRNWRNQLVQMLVSTTLVSAAAGMFPCAGTGLTGAAASRLGGAVTRRATQPGLASAVPPPRSRQGRGRPPATGEIPLRHSSPSVLLHRAELASLLQATSSRGCPPLVAAPRSSSPCVTLPHSPTPRPRKAIDARSPNRFFFDKRGVRGVE
jgi:hypothetical protein